MMIGASVIPISVAEIVSRYSPGMMVSVSLAILSAATPSEIVLTLLGPTMSSARNLASGAWSSAARLTGNTRPVRWSFMPRTMVVKAGIT